MKSHRNPRRIQRGSIIVNVAISLSLIAILLIGSELGYLFYLKRELQKTADLAALAGATRISTSNCSAGLTAALSNANDATAGNMPAGLDRLISAEVTCGQWTSAGTGTTAASRFTVANSNLNAVQVQFSRTPESLLSFFNGNRTISVHAVAAQALPRANLNIRNSLATINSTQSAILNSLFKGILGGNLNLTAVGWSGLASSDINLLSYFDGIIQKYGVSLNLAAGEYEKLLNTNISISQLADVLLTLATQNGSLTSIQISDINSQRANFTISNVAVKLGDTLQIANNTPSSALSANVQALQLLQGIVGLATGNNTAAIDVSLGNVFGIVAATAKIKIGEKPQVSATGNPALVTGGIDDPNRIYVRTAQIRALVTLSIPGLSTVSNLLLKATDLLTPVTNILSSILSLDLKCLISCQQNQAQIVLTPGNPVQLNVAVDVASSESWINSYSCSPTKSITVNQKTGISNIYAGQMTSTQASDFFSSNNPASIGVFPVFDVETRACTKTLLGILWTCGAWSKYSRTGLRVASPVAATTAPPFTFSNPPNINDTSTPTQYATIGASDIFSSLSGTLSGVELQTYLYDNTKPNSLGNTIGGATDLVTTALSLASSLISTLLSPIDSLINSLLDALGLRLASAETSARLTCSQGAELVY